MVAAIPRHVAAPGPWRPLSSRSAYRTAPTSHKSSPMQPSPCRELKFAVLLGRSRVPAGAEPGAEQLDPRQALGMGVYAPRVDSPLTGEPEAAPSAGGFVFDSSTENLARWERWWRSRLLDGVRRARPLQRRQLHPDPGPRTHGSRRTVIRVLILGDRHVPALRGPPSAPQDKLSRGLERDPQPHSVLVWGLVAIRTLMLLAGFDRPFS